MKVTHILTVPLIAVLLAGPMIAFADDKAPDDGGPSVNQNSGEQKSVETPPPPPPSGGDQNAVNQPPANTTPAAPPPPPAPPPTAAQTGGQDSMQGTVAPSAVKSDLEHYSQQQLDQMLAPIALYPDQLVMNLLMASTYPLQLVDASRWLQDPKNATLKGDQLMDALQNLSWDPSVKSLTAYPDVVTLLNKNLDWTQALGLAFANQQADVMAQLQFLRQQASKAGDLESNDKMVVQNDGPNIVLTPADADAFYVPYYDPRVVYGPWPWNDYPPVWFADYYCGCTPVFVRGWAWGPRWVVVRPLWGWFGVRWGYGGGVFVRGGGVARFHRAGFAGGAWHHVNGIHVGVGIGPHGGIGIGVHGGGIGIGVGVHGAGPAHGHPAGHPAAGPAHGSGGHHHH